MKRELKHFCIGSSYGGNQDWFPTFMMKIGGCGAETACDSSIYFALHCGLTALAPPNAAALTKDDYVRFAYEMKPYLSPRMTGIDRTDIYIDGYARFIRDRGEARLSMTALSGEEPLETACAAVTRQIDNGCPVPTLILNHQDKRMEDYVWHWFLINGYEKTETDFFVKTVTYSHYEWLRMADLWHTGFRRRGGLVLYHINVDS
ncbi:MAG: hypothetical protein U0L60_01685 [Ruminococcus sp.]|nr:hypothetical protein [Ruminococcus sp.]